MTIRDSHVVGGVREPAVITFVTGASRSGTTMLSRVLGNHSQALWLMELHYFGDLIHPEALTKPLDERELQRLATRLLARQARGVWIEGPTGIEQRQATRIVAELPPERRTGADIFAAVLDTLAAQAGKHMVCEQTPRNIFYAERLLEIYPHARVVHIVRDPRAVLASQKNRWRRKRMGVKHIPWSEVLRSWANYHPVTMGRLWVEANRVALDLIGHPRFMLLRFEDLVQGPEGEVRKICRFLGVEFERAMLDVPQVNSSNRPNLADRKGIATDVLDRWPQILSESEIAICERVTERLMKRFSYAPRLQRRHALHPALVPQLLRYPLHIVGVLLTNPRRAWVQFNAATRHRSIKVESASS
jgi:hypothetical protein